MPEDDMSVPGGAGLFSSSTQPKKHAQRVTMMRVCLISGVGRVPKESGNGTGSHRCKTGPAPFDQPTRRGATRDWLPFRYYDRRRVSTLPSFPFIAAGAPPAGLRTQPAQQEPDAPATDRTDRTGLSRPRSSRQHPSHLTPAFHYYRRRNANRAARRFRSRPGVAMVTPRARRSRKRAPGAG